MKFMTISLLLSSLSSFAQFSFKPSMYNCMDKNKNLLVSYSTSSLRGLPQLTYQELSDGQADVRVFAEGERILTNNTVMGKLLFVEGKGHLADGPYKAYGLILPEVHMRDPHGLITFDTYVIQTTKASTFGRPNVDSGTVEKNKVIKVKCRGSRVMF